jgi:general secretion pathway protein G
MLLRSHHTHAPTHALRASRTGFTLLEVLVVVAIIVMLAGVGGYYAFQQYESSRVSRAKIDAEGLSSLAEQYKLNNGDYPQSIEQLAMPQGVNQTPLCSIDKTRDPWGKPYQIDPAGTRNGGNKADIFTITPKGLTVGNFPMQ